jgi:hypothetical protein
MILPLRRPLYNLAMATSTPTIETEAAGKEPDTRTISRELPNLRNRAVAEEYRRQRAILQDAAASQRSEMEFWEAAQSSEGWL